MWKEKKWEGGKRENDTNVKRRKDQIKETCWGSKVFFSFTSFSVFFFSILFFVFVGVKGEND